MPARLGSPDPDVLRLSEPFGDKFISELLGQLALMAGLMSTTVGRQWPNEKIQSSKRFQDQNSAR